VSRYIILYYSIVYIIDYVIYYIIVCYIILHCIVLYYIIVYECVDVVDAPLLRPVAQTTATDQGNRDGRLCVIWMCINAYTVYDCICICI